jgi:hypothetical protein
LLLTVPVENRRNNQNKQRYKDGDQMIIAGAFFLLLHFEPLYL